MSIQFGEWSFDGHPTRPDCFARASCLLAAYGPDGDHVFCDDRVTINYRAFHTTKESREETQPYKSRHGTVFTWDGRLDNRVELIHELNNGLSSGSCDVVIVSAAYERWGLDSFARLIGDWALSVWIPDQNSLILAKDPIGTRQLFYSLDDAQLKWSTVIDPLVLSDSHSLNLNEEYLAGWLSYFPAPQLTPYVGIHSVLPSCFVCVTDGIAKVTRYWDFDSSQEVRYRSDAEYEEHFRTVFAEAVRRRLRSDRPIVAELSGGIDSSSIVCMADMILTRGQNEAPRLDTISYYNDSEPNWGERPYFNQVEKKRGRPGCHIDLGIQRGGLLDFNPPSLAAMPGSGQSVDRRFIACMSSGEYRVLLSGTGGDEVTGGVPTPTPELGDLLVRARFAKLAHQLKAWALEKRRPWVHLLIDTIRTFLPTFMAGIPKYKQPAPWLRPEFASRNRQALEGYARRWTLLGALPTFQENLNALDMLRRQLACDYLSSDPLYEKRYPYLDRSLLEFLYAVPREQLVRPGQRRSLMRRSLAGIVPREILHRKRKAYVGRGIIASISTQSSSLQQFTKEMLCSSLGIVDSELFSRSLRNAQLGEEVPLVPLLRTISLELWLKSCRPFHVSQDTGNATKFGTRGRVLTQGNQSWCS